MKKKILGTLLGMATIAIFSISSTVNSAEAQNELTQVDEKSWDLRVCLVVGGPHQAACDMPAIAGPCWRTQWCQ
jgi:hypothetical protein